MNAETCILVEAGLSIFNERATDSNVCNDMLMYQYVNLVRNFGINNFADSSIKDGLSFQLFAAKKNMTGVCLWENFFHGRKRCILNFQL